jgi:tetratricopeptide (TPR) repeat protein
LWLEFLRRGYANEKIDKNCFMAHYLRGVIHECTGFSELAIDSFTTAIALDPQSCSARYYRGTIYYELGRYSESSADIDRAIAIQECNSEKLLDRDETSFYAEGLALYYTDRLDSAMTMLRLGLLMTTRFNNSSFREYISLCLQRLSGK